MRSLFSSTLPSATTSNPAAEGAWTPGLAHVLTALAIWPVLGGLSCAVGLLMAGFLSFVVWLPLIALRLNGGAALAETDAAPELNPNARRVLFILWTATAWAGALAAR